MILLHALDNWWLENAIIGCDKIWISEQTFFREYYLSSGFKVSNLSYLFLEYWQ